ncbi:MAG: hypothetical protein ACRDI3_01395 [Actinomycetota bacterium]
MNPVAGVLSEAWEMYKTHWRHLLSISVVVYIAVAVITALLIGVFGLFGVLLSILVSFVGIFLVQGALVIAVQDVRDGRADLSLAETLKRVQPSLGAIAGASILAGIGIGIGFLLLIVPGLVLMTFWSVIVPVIVLERAPAMRSFTRSRELVSGNGWNVFGVVVLLFLIQLAFGIVLSIVLAFFPEGLQSFLSNLINGTLTAPFIALAWTLLYYRLTAVRGGTTPPEAQTP